MIIPYNFAFGYSFRAIVPSMYTISIVSFKKIFLKNVIQHIINSFISLFIHSSIHLCEPAGEAVVSEERSSEQLVSCRSLGRVNVEALRHQVQALVGPTGSPVKHGRIDLYTLICPVYSAVKQRTLASHCTRYQNNTAMFIWLGWVWLI